MGLFQGIRQRLLPAEDNLPGGRTRYRRLWKTVVFLTAFVSLAPLVAMTVINYHQYKKAFEAEMIYPISRMTSNTKGSLESFIAERQSVLDLIIHDKSFEELNDQEELGGVFRNLKESFGGFVDLGLIDSRGDQRAYVGPYELMGKNYRDQEWFHEVRLKGSYVSDVFMGFRDFPHFVIAVMHERPDDGFYVLRATIDVAILGQYVMTKGLRATSDAFLINHQGILQTPSRFCGNVLENCQLPVPPYSANAEVIERKDKSGKPYVLGYAYIEQTPFILMEVTRPEASMQNWFALRNNLVGFTAASVFVIVLVILWGSTYLVRHIKEADRQRTQALHNVEYTNKMASIGRLAAGVAHEINNPLSIINENAGLLKDLVSVADEFPRKEKFLKHIESISRSVERCSTITHRLLGFAKRMDTQIETIDIEQLIREVMSFLDKEASHRNVSIRYDISPNLPSIESDRGQLQQVFLNILNNSFEAVNDGGQVAIGIRSVNAAKVAVTISDNGHGIAPQDIRHIFEPFFTTKKKFGTGLGLSITYGILEKLGGQIDVTSQVAKGTTFSVTLPVKGR